MASASGAKAIIAHMKLVIGSKGSHAFSPQLRGILSYRSARGPARWPGILVNFVSDYRQSRAELLTSGLWAEQNRCGDADTTQRGADQHRDRKPQLPVDSKIGDDRCNQAAEYRTLNVTGAFSSGRISDAPPVRGESSLPLHFVRVNQRTH